MKKIIQKALYTRKYDQQKSNEMVKLRLRGRGSGYKEGIEQKESSDALHLCVSSKYEDIFEAVCHQVEDLISHIYKDYKNFCIKNNYDIESFEVKKLYNKPQSKLGAIPKNYEHSGSLS